MDFLNGITLLLIYELIGEASVLILPIPLPGPVVGMVLLFLTLLIQGQSTVALDTAGNALLSHLSLLFVPAGVGLMIHFERIVQEWIAISVALVLSTGLAIATTATIMQIATHQLAGKNNG